MTLIQQGQGSPLTGMIGGIVIAQRNGKTYLRRAPVRKKDSWTQGQRLHRQRFSKVNRFCNSFKDTVIPRIWNGAAENMSGYALFLKANMPAFALDGSLTDPHLVKLSRGKLTLPPQLMAKCTEGEDVTVSVSWEKGPQWGGVHLKDELMVISAGDGIYSEITKTSLVRNDLGGTFTLPARPQPATHLYLFFASRDQRDYSPSLCFEI